MVDSGKRRKLLECATCGEELDREQSSDPRRDDSGEAICDSCYSDEHEFNCCWCGEYDSVDVQHRMIVLFEECGRMDRGIYRIDSFPYYTSDYFNMWFNEYAMTRLGDVPKDLQAQQDNYPAGHLCEFCQTRTVFPRTWGCIETRQLGAVGDGR
jgi:hypothetical protein